MNRVNLGERGVRYIVGVDIGGTFTDCVALKTSDDGTPPVVKIGKSSSTPPDFQTGFIGSLRTAAEMHGVALEEMLANAQVYHGCTVGTNALVEHKTARVGLLASRGHTDTIFIMKAGNRLKFMPANYIAHVAKQTKPEPLVPKALCEGIDERVTFDGKVFAALNEDTARASIRRLVEQGVEAIAISLIWSTANDSHEKRLRELVHEIAPDMFVSISSEVSPRVGEYERTIATIVNSLIGPPMRLYLEALEIDLKAHGYTQTLQIMSCTGGLIDADHARDVPVLTVGSGPVAGLIGAASLATAAEVGGGRNVITADVGGTTLDIGTIFDGTPVRRPTASYGQYEYFVPTLDVRSVGAGGGSIIRAEGAALKVGPHSAGARPGPACFGRGGQEPTVTDAAVVLGFFDPDYFFGGKITLDLAAAEAALARVGAPLGLDAKQTAAAALQIIDSQMADAIWLTLTQQGHDPREFSVYGFGGGGGLHGAAIARELGARSVVVPMSNLAAGWSAFGITASEALVTEQTAMAFRARSIPTRSTGAGRSSKRGLPKSSPSRVFLSKTSSSGALRNCVFSCRSTRWRCPPKAAYTMPPPSNASWRRSRPSTSGFTAKAAVSRPPGSGLPVSRSTAPRNCPDCMSAISSSRARKLAIFRRRHRAKSSGTGAAVRLR